MSTGGRRRVRPLARARSGAVLLLALVLALVCLSCSSGERDVTTLKRLDVPFRFGAYVDPTTYTDDARIAAYEQFERALGRKLDVYHSYHPFTADFPSRGDRHFAAQGKTLLISWSGTDTRDIVSGQHDDLVRQRARALAALDVPVILQWRWEMNRRNLAEEIHSPADYVAAWRHLHALFEQEGVTNVSWAWCPLSDYDADLDFSAYYPGDDVVDYIGANGYARNAGASFADVFYPFLQWARDRPGKPILIGEFARPVDMGSPESLVRWLTRARTTLANNPRIKVVTYFESARGSSGRYDLTKVPGALAALRDWEDPEK